MDPRSGSAFPHSVPFVLFVLVGGFAVPLSAQERPPEECGMTEEAARYGPIEPGSIVTLQRHRFVGGDDNWDDPMSRWIGRAARVTRLAGVDAAGCPGVRVDIDGGRWFWRVRDLGIGTGPQPRPIRRTISVPIPQDCNQDQARPRYGPVAVGSDVILGRHRMVNGDDNWAEEMQAWVGRRARVVELAGVDGAGCPGVRVDVDQQQWFWRIRDLRLASEAGGGGHGGAPTREGRTHSVCVVGACQQGAASGEERMAPSGGVSTDHGRPAIVVTAGSDPASRGGLFGTGGPQTPQECGMTDVTVQWGPIAVGTVVLLGRHREVNGDANWSDEMQSFVGRTASVTELVGVDDQGCPVVHVDADGGAYYWRIRDLQVL